MSDTVLDLTLPPSVNTTRRVDYWGHQKAENWRKDNDKRLMVNRQNKYETIVGAYEITIHIRRTTMRKDPDNILKCLLDYCVSRGAVSDDGPQHIESIHVLWADDLPEQCRVTIRPLST